MLSKIMNLLKTIWARLTFRGTPSPECWVFSSVHNNAFNYNSSYLFLYVKEHCPQLHPYYVMNDEKKRKELEEKYGKGYFIDTNTLEGIRKVLSCKVWFTSTAPPLYGVGFRKKYTIINLWHGVPLKKIGMEQENLSWFTRKYYKYLFADNYEAVLTTSRNLIPVMSRSFLVEPERIKVWGQPRNDMLFREQKAYRILRELYHDEFHKDELHYGEMNNDGIHSGRKDQAGKKRGEERRGRAVPEFEKVILYAPTFRDHAPTRLFPFDEVLSVKSSGPFYVGDGESGKRESERDGNNEMITRLLEFLEKNNIFLCIRSHLYDQTEYNQLKKLDRPGSRIRFLNEDRVSDIMEVLNIFDLLITDYSSIYIDYLLTGRPVVFLPYDREEYLKDRGMNFDYEKVTPGPKPKTFNEFLNSIYDLLYNHDSYVQQRTETNNFFNEVRMPCCELICRNVRDCVKKKNEA